MCVCVCLQGGDLLAVDKNRAVGGRYPDDPTAVDSAVGVSHYFCISALFLQMYIIYTFSIQQFLRGSLEYCGILITV